MPRARTMTAVMVKPGALNSCRKANLKSWIIDGYSVMMERALGLDSGKKELSARPYHAGGRLWCCTLRCSRYLRHRPYLYEESDYDLGNLSVGSVGNRGCTRCDSRAEACHSSGYRHCGVEAQGAYCHRDGHGTNADSDGTWR